MRLFVGVVLPTEIKDELFKIQKNFPKNVAKINWIAKKRLHLTLKFLGEVDEDKLSGIVSALNKVSFDSFEVSVGGVGTSLHNGVSSVIWADILSKENVINLQQRVDAELLSIFKFSQKFNPHLTLGRVKILKNKDKFSKIIKEIKVQKKSFSIDEFCLMKSKLTKDGSKYEIISKFNT
jgi:RNA 2',3'-cyclic 3'-phosphodiesterase